MSQRNFEIKDGKIVFTQKESVRGTRTCPQCGVKESETLKVNDRYSFCSSIVQNNPKFASQNKSLVDKKEMVCIYCYNKNRSRTTTPKSMTLSQINDEIAELETMRQALLNAIKLQSSTKDVKIVKQNIDKGNVSTSVIA